MIYHAEHALDAKEAKVYLNQLIAAKAYFKITKINRKRTLKQNAYLHLLINYFGHHFGYDPEESKQIYKELCPEIFFYEKKGRKFVRSSAALDTKEMAYTIDKFRMKAGEQGCELPLATDQAWLDSMQNEMEKAGYIT